MKLILPLIAVALAAHPPLAAAIYSPADYGAVLNGVANDGSALQRAIDAAHAAGGGTVLECSGSFAGAGAGGTAWRAGS